MVSFVLPLVPDIMAFKRLRQMLLLGGLIVFRWRWSGETSNQQLSLSEWTQGSFGRLACLNQSVMEDVKPEPHE